MYTYCKLMNGVVYVYALVPNDTCVAFPQNVKIQELYLGYNSLGSRGFSALARAIGKDLCFISCKHEKEINILFTLRT